MHFKISHKGKKKKDGGKQLMIFIKEIYGRLVYILCNTTGFVVDINFSDFNGNNYIPR